ncbi:hypothetical protein [Streptomyces sp. NPDC048636]|uniref:hypothetical protein n=1 Tax=Streptomyces sp. NPDC048636 TaxID=3155762 RepID=UPI0034497AEC
MRTFLNVAAVALAGTALVASAGVASAATPSASAAVPSCVVADEQFLGTVWVNLTNNCSTQQRVKVVYQDRVDETCYTLKPGGTATSRLAFNIAHFDRLVSC